MAMAAAMSNAMRQRSEPVWFISRLLRVYRTTPHQHRQPSQHRAAEQSHRNDHRAIGEDRPLRQTRLVQNFENLLGGEAGHQLANHGLGSQLVGILAGNHEGRATPTVGLYQLYAKRFVAVLDLIRYPLEPIGIRRARLGESHYGSRYVTVLGPEGKH